jgi:hypothetical protein
MLVVASAGFQGTDATLQQNIQENLTVFLSSNGLASVVDSSDVINATYATAGVDRVTLTLFNVSGSTGIVRTVTAERNEFISSGTIEITIEER